MKALCLFGQIHQLLSDEILLNALEMAKVNQCGLTLLIDTYTRTHDRAYLDILGVKNTLRDQLQQNTDEYITSTYNQILALINAQNINVTFCIECIVDKNWEKKLTQVLSDIESEWLLINSSPKTYKHPIFKKLAKLPTSILLMKDIKWKQKPIFLAAIDPLHRHDRPATLDQNITSIALQISTRFNTNFTIIHCCYLTPYLVKYSKKIIEIHSNTLNEFRTRHHLEHIPCVLLHGNPEDQIFDYVKKKQCNILIIGGFCRSSISNFWLGSTTEKIVQAMPCDVFLIKPQG
jgi:nucleotide-binding universal stress UspA family protein